jgi:hypothetical protein
LIDAALKLGIIVRDGARRRFHHLAIAQNVKTLIKRHYFVACLHSRTIAHRGSGDDSPTSPQPSFEALLLLPTT